MFDHRKENMVSVARRSVPPTPALFDIEARDTRQVFEMRSTPKPARPASSRPLLMTQHAWRVANVCLNRYLGRPPKYLPIILLFVTNRCNLRCRMCGVWEHEAPKSTEELTTDEWKTVIASGAELGVFLCSFTGGEVLLRPDIFELTRYAADYGMSVHVCTNGTILNEAKVDELRDSGVGTVSISLESPDRQVHDNLRGEGTFDRAVAGIRLLRERAPDVQVGINTLICAENFRDMHKMIPFAESLGAHQIKFAPIHTNLQHKNKALEEFADLLFDEARIAELDAEVAKLTEAAAKTRLRTTSSMFLTGITRLYTEPRRFRCYAGYAACAINPTGMVTPCCDMEGSFSVRAQPLEAIWRSPEFHAMRKRVAKCSRDCWDTTNTELSLRLTPRGLLREMLRTWRDMGFYFGKGRS